MQILKLKCEIPIRISYPQLDRIREGSRENSEDIINAISNLIYSFKIYVKLHTMIIGETGIQSFGHAPVNIHKGRRLEG